MKDCPKDPPGISFNVTPTEAVQQQKKLREMIELTPLSGPVRLIAGADVSFNKYEEDVYAGIIVFSYPDFTPVEHACVRSKVKFPYVPGLLSYREIPPLLKAWELLKNIPDVVVVDGHGIAHPRRLGIATHFGLTTGVPTIGCAKNILYGRTEEPALTRGSFTDIIDPKTDEVIGISLRTKDKVKPVFVAPGNKTTLKEAHEIIMNSLRGYRLPEETRQAHLLVNRFRKGELASSSLDHHLY